MAKSRDIAARCQEVPWETFHANGPGQRLACGPRLLGYDCRFFLGFAEHNRRKGSPKLNKTCLSAACCRGTGARFEVQGYMEFLANLPSGSNLPFGYTVKDLHVRSLVLVAHCLYSLLAWHELLNPAAMNRSRCTGWAH